MVCTQFKKRFRSNDRRAPSLRVRPQKRVTMKMVGLFTTEATIRIKDFWKEELIQWKHIFFRSRILGRGCDEALFSEKEVFQ